MKRVYLIRHGATDGSVSGVQQSPETPLNIQGLKEAARIAARAEQLNFQTLVSSPAQRALETAEAIGSAVKQEMVLSDLFAERRRPTRFNGWDKKVPEYVAYREAEGVNLHNPDWKFEDSESYTELVERTKAAFDYLEKMSGDIAVVSHEFIAKFFVTYLLSAGTPTPELWAQMYTSLRLTNTGITVFQHSDVTGWQLLTWNDHAHFAE